MKTLSRLWSQNPALIYGLCAFIGSCLALYRIECPLLLSLAVLFGGPLLYFSVISPRLRIRVALAAALGCAAFCFTKEYYLLPPSSEKSLTGIADVRFTAVSKAKTPFGGVWYYRGILQSFVVDQQRSTPHPYGIVRNIPISLTLPVDNNEERPLATHSYKLRARLKSNSPGKYSLAISQNTYWETLESIWGLAEWRIGAKTAVQQHIHNAIKDPHTAAFLAGIATGEFDDRILAFELGRFGLQHLMAISGLHFAILAIILGFLLRLFMTYKTSAAALLAILSTYFVFLGSSAPVMRAWIAIAIALCGLIVGRRGSGLNSLGIALLAVALLDPFAASNIGFQFSFAVTAAILIWHAPCDALLQSIFVKRRLSNIADMGRLDQHGYCVLVFLRQALALGVAVNLAALPLTLYHFHKFPLMSLVYNLFFPFMISLSILLLVAAFLASLLLPSLGSLLHSINENYTRFLLDFAFNLPKTFDLTIRVNEFSFEPLLLYLLLLFTCGIYVKNRIKGSLLT